MPVPDRWGSEARLFKAMDGSGSGSISLQDFIKNYPTIMALERKAEVPRVLRGEGGGRAGEGLGGGRGHRAHWRHGAPEAVARIPGRRCFRRRMPRTTRGGVHWWHSGSPKPPLL